MVARDEWTAWALQARVPRGLGSRRIGTMGAKLLLVALCQYANDRGEAWPSATRLADDLGISRSEVRDGFTILANAGLIKRADESVQPGRITRWIILADLAGIPLSDEPVENDGEPVDNDSEPGGQPGGQPGGEPGGEPEGYTHHERNGTEGLIANQSSTSPQTAHARSIVGPFDLTAFRAARPDLERFDDVTLKTVAIRILGSARDRGGIDRETAYVLRSFNPEREREADNLTHEQAMREHRGPGDGRPF